jgi:hypothetical protein
LTAIGLLVWVIGSIQLMQVDRPSRRGIATAAGTLDRALVAADTLLADETPVPQLDPGRGKTKKAYLWAYRSNDLPPGPRLVVFNYQTSRDGEHVRQFLADWQGHLMVDD